MGMVGTTVLGMDMNTLVELLQCHIFFLYSPIVFWAGLGYDTELVISTSYGLLKSTSDVDVVGGGDRVYVI